jgi:hypothetical protein
MQGAVGMTEGYRPSPQGVPAAWSSLLCSLAMSTSAK